MDRRKFLAGAVSTVVAGFLPKSSDGVALESIAHPKYTNKTYAKSWVISKQALEESYVDVGARMHAALARSMMQTKENVAARVFWDHQFEFLHIEGVTMEEFYKENDE